MTLPDLLQGLSRSLDLAPLELNDQGVCQLVIDDRLTVSIEHLAGENRAQTYAVIAALPVDEDRRAALYASLLEAQLFSKEIGQGCTFGLDAKAGEILIQKSLELELLDAATFADELGELVNWALHWHEKLRGNNTSSEPAPYERVGVRP